jgi:hypothetical protein
MPNKQALNWWERNVLWVVSAVLIAGWWGILGFWLNWQLDSGVVWFATLNSVLTLRFAVGVANRRFEAAYGLFALVARITAVWLPIAFAGLVPLVFFSFLSSSVLCDTLPFGEKQFRWATIHALTVSAGTGAVAFLTIYKHRGRLLTAPDTFGAP